MNSAVFRFFIKKVSVKRNSAPINAECAGGIATETTITENLFIALPVNTAARNSAFTETNIVYIAVSAVRIAFIKHELEDEMTSKEFNNEKLYQTTMSLMRSLLMQGAITQKE